MANVKISALPVAAIGGGDYIPCVVGGVTSKATAASIAALTGITSLGSGVSTWLATPTGALLGTALTSALPIAKVGAPTGTGLAKVSGGSWSAAAATLVNADVSASAGIAVSKLAPAGTNGFVLTTTGGAAVWAAAAGGGGSPGGSTTQVQFNDAGSFNGNAAFTFDKTTGMVSASLYVPSGSPGTLVPANGMLRTSYVAGDTNTFYYITVNGNGTDYIFAQLVVPASAFYFGDPGFYSIFRGYSAQLIATTGLVTCSESVSGITTDLTRQETVLAANFTNNTTTLNATNLSVPIAVGETWRIRWQGFALASTGTLGMKLGVLAGGGLTASVDGWMDGCPTAVTARTGARINAFNAATSNAIATAVGVLVFFEVVVTVSNVTVAGTISLAMASGAAGVTETLNAITTGVEARRVTQV